MMVSVNVITQDEVMKNAVMFRENAEARYGVVPDWEQAFAAVPCASCNGLEILSKEGLCRDCDETGLAKKEVAAEEEGRPWVNDTDDIWLRLADGQLVSWCGCSEPGKEVLPCGHCGCWTSDLCWEWVVAPGSTAGVAKRRKASCA